MGREWRAGDAGAAAGGRPAHRRARGRTQRWGTGAKVGRDRLRGGERSRLCLGAEGGGGAGTCQCRAPGRRRPVQGSHRRFFRTCDSSSGFSSGAFARFTAFRPQRPSAGAGWKPVQILRGWFLRGLVARDPEGLCGT